MNSTAHDDQHDANPKLKRHEINYDGYAPYSYPDYGNDEIKTFAHYADQFHKTRIG